MVSGAGDSLHQLIESGSNHQAVPVVADVTLRLQVLLPDIGIVWWRNTCPVIHPLHNARDYGYDWDNGNNVSDRDSTQDDLGQIQ